MQLEKKFKMKKTQDKLKQILTKVFAWVLTIPSKQ